MSGDVRQQAVEALREKAVEAADDAIRDSHSQCRSHGCCTFEWRYAAAAVDAVLPLAEAATAERIAAAMRAQADHLNGIVTPFAHLRSRYVHEARHLLVAADWVQSGAWRGAAPSAPACCAGDTRRGSGHTRACEQERVARWAAPPSAPAGEPS